MSKLYDYIIDDNGLMIKLRMDNEFDESEYEKIKSALLEIIPEWKSMGKVDVDDFSGLLDLIQLFAGGSRFWSEEDALRVEDAELELMDIIHDNLRL